MLTLKKIFDEEQEKQTIQNLASALGFSEEIKFYLDNRTSSPLTILVTLDQNKKHTDVNRTCLLEAKLQKIFGVGVEVIVKDALTDPLKFNNILISTFGLKEEDKILSYLKKSSLNDIRFTASLESNEEDMQEKIELANQIIAESTQSKKRRHPNNEDNNLAAKYQKETPSKTPSKISITRPPVNPHGNFSR